MGCRLVTYKSGQGEPKPPVPIGPWPWATPAPFPLGELYQKEDQLLATLRAVLQLAAEDVLNVADAVVVVNVPMHSAHVAVADVLMEEATGDIGPSGRLFDSNFYHLLPAGGHCLFGRRTALVRGPRFPSGRVFDGHLCSAKNRKKISSEVFKCWG